MNKATRIKQPIRFRRWIAVWARCWAAVLDHSDYPFPQKIQGHCATLEEGSWVSTSYLVAEIVVIPLTGWLARYFHALVSVVNAACLSSFPCADSDESPFDDRVSCSEVDGIHILTLCLC